MYCIAYISPRTSAEKFDKFPVVREATEKDRKKALLSLFRGEGTMKKILGRKYAHFVPF